MRFSIIVPASNEEAYLGPTLYSIRTAEAHLRNRAGVDIEIVVVDNNSADETAAVAPSKGATVVSEPVQGISRARNAGARHAKGDVLVFVDADVIVPRTLLEAIHAVTRDPACIGGGVDVEYRPQRLLTRLYLRAWRLLANRMAMVQGATQFCRRDVFEQVGGYDEKDVDRRGCRLLLGSQEAREEDQPRGEAHTEPASAVHLARRFDKLAAVEDPGLDQPSLHRSVPALEGGLGRLVLRCGPVDSKGPEQRPCYNRLSTSSPRRREDHEAAIHKRNRDDR